MKLYVIRHAHAVSTEQLNVPTDADRHLSEKGYQQCQTLAESLQQLDVRINVLLTSPLLRARQTAEHLVTCWSEPKPSIVECKALAPGGKRKKILQGLHAHLEDSVGVVGHAPDLGELVAWLIGSKDANIELSKAGVACISFEGGPGKGTGELEWLVTPMWCQGALRLATS